jgi:hypothetical protein
MTHVLQAHLGWAVLALNSLISILTVEKYYLAKRFFFRDCFRPTPDHGKMSSVFLFVGLHRGNLQGPQWASLLASYGSKSFPCAAVNFLWAR